MYMINQIVDLPLYFIPVSWEMKVIETVENDEKTLSPSVCDGRCGHMLRVGRVKLTSRIKTVFLPGSILSLRHLQFI